jgi:predicted transcriptional regulator
MHLGKKYVDNYWPTSRINGVLLANQYIPAAQGGNMGDVQPTDRELEALKVLWEHSEATVRDVCDALNERGVELAYTTVLSLLQVMEQKRLVAHRRRGKAYVYLPLVERDKTFRELAGGFLERVFDGAVDEYLVHALQSRRMTAAELDELESMIAGAKRQAAKRGGRSNHS